MSGLYIEFLQYVQKRADEGDEEAKGIVKRYKEKLRISHSYVSKR